MKKVLVVIAIAAALSVGSSKVALSSVPPADPHAGQTFVPAHCDFYPNPYGGPGLSSCFDDKWVTSGTSQK
jgi:hypothetical protein